MKNKYSQFLSQDKRDELNNEINETIERMKQTKGVHKTYNEALVDWLPQSQRKNAGGPSYTFLCQQLKMFLEGKYNREGVEALRLAKENYESYCERMEALDG